MAVGKAWHSLHLLSVKVRSQAMTGNCYKVARMQCECVITHAMLVCRGRMGEFGKVESTPARNIIYTRLGTASKCSPSLRHFYTARLSQLDL